MTEKKITATLKFYRKSDLDETNIYKHYDAKKGDEYIEFLETWERPWGDELGKLKQRVSQEATGKRFYFLDIVTLEFAKEHEIDADEVLYRPEDFMAIRMKEIK